MGKVAINGLGRVGRLLLRHFLKHPDVQVTAVNDLADATTLAHLIRHDSIYGEPGFSVAVDGHQLILDGRCIQVFSESDPRQIPFGSLGTQLVLECSGCFTPRHRAAAHLRGSVRQVLVSALSEGADRTVVMGVNDGTLDPSRDKVISGACATSQCLAPIVKVLDEAFGLAFGFVTAVQSYTNEQRILDLPHGDLRLARAATLSMIPTGTGAAQAVGLVLPHLEGRLDGLAVRVPTPTMSILDLTAMLHGRADLEAINGAFRQAAETGPLAPYLAVLEEELVSADLVGRSASALYDPFLTKVLGPSLVKVFAWYDQEFAYAARLKDLSIHLLRGLGQ